VKDSAEVNRLFHRKGLPKATIVRRLGMSRNTVVRLLGLNQPPRYVWSPQGSQLDGFAEAIAAMLDADPRVSATVIRAHLRPLGSAGGITILNRPAMLDQSLPNLARRREAPAEHRGGRSRWPVRGGG
jgi:hypothetical protein